MIQKKTIALHLSNSFSTPPPELLPSRGEGKIKEGIWGQPFISIRTLVSLCILGLLLGAAGLVQAQPRENIDVQAPISQKKFTIAVPHLQPLGGGGPDLGSTLAGQTDQSLKTSGLFNVLDPASYNAGPLGSMSPPPGKLQYFSQIGCNLVIIGGFQPEGNNLLLEMRLYEPVTGQMLLGKRYRGGANESPKMITQFVNEVIVHLTGKRGLPTGKIAFISGGNDAKELYLMDLGGAAPKQLTKMGTITLTPAWTPDGQEIIFCSYRGGFPALYAVNPGSGAVRKLQSHGTLNITPAAGPGGMIAATLNKDNDQEIYLLNRQGGIQRRLTQSPGIDISPSFSPDGQQMAFVSNRGGNPQIFVMSTQGGQPRRLSFAGGYNVSPAWSPRGDQIAYAGRTGGGFQIFLISPQGGGARQLTHEGSNESPTWSPDGQFIACSSTRGGKKAIYVVNVSTGAMTQATNMAGQQTQPTWAPGK